MDETNDAYTIAVVGGGSAAEALIRKLADSDHRIVVFEPNLLGGECPFYACMPSKAMLHDRSTERSWEQAVERREEVTSHLDDSEHVREAEDLGVASCEPPRRSSAPAGSVPPRTTYAVDHVVVATGARDIVPDIDGLDMNHPRVWSSEDALTAIDRPRSVVVIGGGVIGSELAFMFSGFDIDATTLDTSERPADDLHPRVSELIEQTLRNAGVAVHNGIQITRVELTDRSASVHLADGSAHAAECLLVAVGRSPRLDGIGLESLGLDPAAIDIDERGRVVSDRRPRRVAPRRRRRSTAVHPRREPPCNGRRRSSRRRRHAPLRRRRRPRLHLHRPAGDRGRSAVGRAPGRRRHRLGRDRPRNAPQHDRRARRRLPRGRARRSTGCLVAANGIGARFDEIVHAIVTAIDGQVPVARLAQTMQPFPTVGEILGQAYGDLAAQLAA